MPFHQPLFIAVLTVFTLSGCASNVNWHGILNPSEERAKRKKAKEIKRAWRQDTLSWRTRVDVDTAYARVKRAFGYESRKEVLSQGEWGRWAVQDGAFKYEATPGALYHMSRVVAHTYKGDVYKEPLRTDLEKDGKGTRVQIRYWVNPKLVDSTDAYGASIKKRVVAALKR